MHREARLRTGAPALMRKPARIRQRATVLVSMAVNAMLPVDKISPVMPAMSRTPPNMCTAA